MIQYRKMFDHSPSLVNFLRIISSPDLIKITPIKFEIMIENFNKKHGINVLYLMKDDDECILMFPNYDEYFIFKLGFTI